MEFNPVKRYRTIKPWYNLWRSAKKRQKQLAKWEGRRFDLIETKIQLKSDFNWSSIIEIGISGQESLTVKQFYTMERLYKNKNDWRVKIAIWLINRTPI